MPRACILIRDQPHYRRDAFVAGLKSVGIEVQFTEAPDPKPGDVLVIWNRYGPYHQIALKWEKARAQVIVAENGYLGKDAAGLQRYALARNGHNGSGTWHVGGPERFAALGVELKPWRTEGEHVLVCGQRGIGSPSMASPPNWHESAAARLRKLTRRPIKVRAHPGNNPPKVSLAEDLRDAWACVIWSSGSGVQALVAGIPVVYAAPHWICERAAEHNFETIEKIDDRGGLLTREEAMQRMAWAQWTLDEIASGEPFRMLIP